jgi:hypothetical protein
VQWDSICLPKKLGGLGIMDLRTQNDALLLRWLWTIHASPHAIWSTKLRSQISITQTTWQQCRTTHATSSETYRQYCHYLILRCKFSTKVLSGFNHLQGNIPPDQPISSSHTGESNFLTLTYPGNYRFLKRLSVFYD